MGSDVSASAGAAGEYAAWIGRSASTDDEVTLSAARRMAAMLDLDPDDFVHGSAIPPHWYSMFFTPNARRSEIGDDGHPRKGGFLPPIPLPRRMFVGRKVAFPGVLRVGDRARKHSEIVAIEPKQGRSGKLVFVKVRHTIAIGGQQAVVEDQEVVYREASKESARAEAAFAQVPADPAWSMEYEMDSVLAFRYSALTWNGHRIHYDADYARREEGYPGCVINGALTVHLVVEEALKRAAGRRLAGLSARLVRPLYVGDTLSVGGRALQQSRLEAWAGDQRGHLAATCILDFEQAA